MREALFKKERAAFIIAILMISFGLAEVVTGFRHEFFGLVTSEDGITTLIGVILGLCYFFAGILLLIFNKRSLTLAIILLLIDVGGRIYMMISGMYPLDSFRQASGIIIGTLIAAAFTVFVFFKQRKLTT